MEEIRDNALSLRMVQIGETFSRFRRIVRDVSQELGKDIELEIHGRRHRAGQDHRREDLGDPLMHIVRNSIDHGIEPAEVRRARGKPATGTLSLHASHESGSIVIEVSDDGGGLDQAADPGQGGGARPGHRRRRPLATQEIINLIFEPGFSTADAVSNLSGRGVGMDVVRRNIDELRGTIEVESRGGPGHHHAHAPAAHPGHHRRLPGGGGRRLLRACPWTWSSSAWTWAPSWSPSRTT